MAKIGNKGKEKAVVTHNNHWEHLGGETDGDSNGEQQGLPPVFVYEALDDEDDRCHHLAHAV
jgi:hypothetical protein